jgi:hypothetical protein
MKKNPSRHLRGLLISAALAVAFAAPTAPAATSSPTPAASVSEMLEQGIYNEETKGDIDAAIAIYLQLIAQAIANQSVAAQAEFRLGQCYLKKGRKDDATAAFRKLVSDFPNETQLVSSAQAYLSDGLKLGPAPWAPGERLQMKLYLANGAEAGVMEYRSDLAESGTQPIWRVGGYLSAMTVSAVSSVDLEPLEIFDFRGSRRGLSSRRSRCAASGPGRGHKGQGARQRDRQRAGDGRNPAAASERGLQDDASHFLELRRRIPAC